MKKWLLSLMFISLSAFAGNGSSGGGNIFGDQLNPWFLQNTKTVNYCVEIAPEFSSIPKTRILEIISKSFAYWKKTFTNYSGNFEGDFPFTVNLGSQEFILNEACTEATDLKFQLGFLTADQKKEITNYRQLLGLAYRTSYDEANLRAKGFIYIAPETGVSRPLSPNLHQAPWSFGKNIGFELILTHEMGHIFGLQDDHYSSGGLMSAKFADLVTSKSAIRYVNSVPAKDIPSPFGCNAGFEGDHEFEFLGVEIPGDIDPTHSALMSDDLRTMLGLPKNYKARFQTVKGLMTIKVEGKKFGHIKLSDFGEISGSRADTAISVYLTKKQKVFTNLPNIAFNTHLDIYHVVKSISRKGEELKLVDGKSLSVFVQYDQSCIPSVGMIHDDEVHFDIFAGL